MRAPWFTSKLKRLCSKKEKFYRRAKKSGDKLDWEKFTRVREQVDRSIRNPHRTHVSSILENGHPKDFWRYVKSRRTDNTGVQPLKAVSPSSFPDLPPSTFPDMPPGADLAFC